MSRKSDRRAVAKLDALYAQLPRVACRGLCAEACGPIPMSELEAERLRRADPHRRLPTLRADGRCCYLTSGDRCSVYDVRPLICRVWGVVKRMSCMHGCAPDRWLSDHEFLRLAQGIERVGGPLVVSTIGALEPEGGSYLDLNGRVTSESLADKWAELTRSLRALHGGRIVGVTPEGGPGGGWIDVDARREERRRRS